MTFELLIDELRDGKSFEKICEEQGCNLVECVDNKAYYDADLEEFLDKIGAMVEDFGVGYSVISTVDGKYYEVPYEETENRFDEDLEDEIILMFEPNKIYDVTRYYVEDVI